MLLWPRAMSTIGFGPWLIWHSIHSFFFVTLLISVVCFYRIRKRAGAFSKGNLKQSLLVPNNFCSCQVHSNYRKVKSCLHLFLKAKLLNWEWRNPQKNSVHNKIALSLDTHTHKNSHSDDKIYVQFYISVLWKSVLWLQSVQISFNPNITHTRNLF